MKKKAARSSVSRVSHTASSGTQSDEMKAFYVHFIIYLMVILALFVYLYSNARDLNVLYWVVIGWGIGLVAHALSAFGWMKIMHKEW